MYFPLLSCYQVIIFISCIFSLYIASIKYISCTCRLKRRRNYFTGGSLCDREKSLSEQTLRLKIVVKTVMNGPICTHKLYFQEARIYKLLFLLFLLLAYFCAVLFPVYLVTKWVISGGILLPAEVPRDLDIVRHHCSEYEVEVACRAFSHLFSRIFPRD